MLIFKKEKHARHLVLEHLRNVRECVTESRNALEEYLAGDLEATEQKAAEVSRLESEADNLVDEIRNVLLDGAFLCHLLTPFPRSIHEGHVEALEQGLGLCIGLRGGYDDDIHAAD